MQPYTIFDDQFQQTFLATYYTQTKKVMESGEYVGDAFDLGTELFYKMVHAHITEGKPMEVTAEQAAMIISVIEKVHAENPLQIKF